MKNIDTATAGRLQNWNQIVGHIAWRFKQNIPKSHAIIPKRKGMWSNIILEKNLTGPAEKTKTS